MPKESYAINIQRRWIKDPNNHAGDYDMLVENEDHAVLVFDSRLAAIKYAKEHLVDLIIFETGDRRVLSEINDFTEDSRLLLYTFSLLDLDTEEKILSFEISLKYITKHYVR